MAIKTAKTDAREGGTMTSDGWNAQDWTDAMIRVMRALMPITFSEKFLFMHERWVAGSRPYVMIAEWIAYAEILGIKNSDAGNYVISRLKYQIKSEAAIAKAEGR